MTDVPFVITDGADAGLYVIVNGRLLHVKDEVRPYAPLFDNIILDKVDGSVFFTSVADRFVNDKKSSFVVAPQDKQDEYAFYYRGEMPYCNGVVFAVKNSLIPYDVIDQDQVTSLKPRCLFAPTPSLKRGITSSEGSTGKTEMIKMLNTPFGINTKAMCASTTGALAVSQPEGVAVAEEEVEEAEVEEAEVAEAEVAEAEVAEAEVAEEDLFSNLLSSEIDINMFIDVQCVIKEW